jgi:hypothetical protein
LKDLAVIQPSLKVIGQGLDLYSRFKSFCFHSFDGFGGKIINETQCVRSGRPDIDVGALRILVPQPFDRLLDLKGALPFPQDHLTAIALDAEIEAHAAHRTKLLSHQPLHEHGRSQATSLSIFFGHRTRYRNLPTLHSPQVRPPYLRIVTTSDEIAGFHVHRA